MSIRDEALFGWTALIYPWYSTLDYTHRAGVTPLGARRSVYIILMWIMFFHPRKDVHFCFYTVEYNWVKYQFSLVFVLRKLILCLKKASVTIPKYQNRFWSFDFRFLRFGTSIWNRNRCNARRTPGRNVLLPESETHRLPMRTTNFIVNKYTPLARQLLLVLSPQTVQWSLSSPWYFLCICSFYFWAFLGCIPAKSADWVPQNLGKKGKQCCL